MKKPQKSKAKKSKKAKIIIRITTDIAQTFSYKANMYVQDAILLALREVTYTPSTGIIIEVLDDGHG